MKNLQDISEPEAKEICRLAGEPFLDFMTNITDYVNKK